VTATVPVAFTIGRHHLTLRHRLPAGATITFIRRS
jgi:hypothetical protein